jgi:folate-dependent tRNA-U54 methylase TrmFO/GidA
MNKITIIGGGLAGSEAAFQAYMVDGRIDE